MSGISQALFLKWEKMNKLEYVKVEFIGEWMGNKAPMKMTILKQKALDLESKGIVVILDSRTENKSLDFPPKDKMVKDPKVKKGKNKK